MAKVRAIEVVEAARQLLGAKYCEGTSEWPLPDGPLFYIDHRPDRYTRDFVHREGVNWSGLVNWARA
jgi:hypothetical protein